MVANLLHAFDWSFPDGMTPDQLDMSDGLGITLPLQNSLIAVAKPRWHRICTNTVDKFICCTYV